MYKHSLHFCILFFSLIQSFSHHCLFRHFFSFPPENNKIEITALTMDENNVGNRDSKKWKLDSNVVPNEFEVLIDFSLDSQLHSKAPKTKGFLRNRSNVKQSSQIGRSYSSAAMGLRSLSLRFVDKSKMGKDVDAWKALGKQFNLLAVNGRLLSDDFGFCIGMADSKEFAIELFNTLARHGALDTTNGLTKETLREFWNDMSDQNPHSRLQILL